MKKMIPPFVIAFLFLFIMTPPCLSTVRHMTKEELILKSQYVIHGIVKEVRCDWNEDHSSIYTHVTLQVLDVFKGEPRDEMVLITLGGTVGDKTIWVSDQPELTEGMEVIVHAFLTSTGYFGIRGLMQGVYDVSDGVVGDKRGEVNMTLVAFRKFVNEVSKQKEEE
jgi:hypothetical protein